MITSSIMLSGAGTLLGALGGSIAALGAGVYAAGSAAADAIANCPFF